MLVLGIETSCDDTACAVVDENGVVYAEAIANQFEWHRPYGGVVPEIASRRHLEHLPLMIEHVLGQAGVNLDAIDAIAVTQGPGLLGSLLVGIQAASGLGWAAGIPVYPVHHVRAHLLAPFLSLKGSDSVFTPLFPYTGLCASGGHSGIYRVQGPGEVFRLGETRDDAAGEAFDKIAKLIGLSYPGGPAVEKAAVGGDPEAIEFPRAFRDRNSLEFSFSGLKTAVVQHVRKHGIPEGQEMKDLCASFQQAVIEPLAHKAVSAAQKEGSSNLAVTGGVASNNALRQLLGELCSETGIRLMAPVPRWCTDNGAMIALEAALGISTNTKKPEIPHAVSTWPLPVPQHSD